MVDQQIGIFENEHTSRVCHWHFSFLSNFQAWFLNDKILGELAEVKGTVSMYNMPVHSERKCQLLHYERHKVASRYCLDT